MILDKIVADNLIELQARKQRVPLDELQRLIVTQSPPVDFYRALQGKIIKLIAEVKKASPSKGIIRADFNPVKIALTYADNGATAISVLTESKYFQGSLDNLVNIRKEIGNKLPLLRKDFIHDSYQIYEARAYGADAVLLIVAMLDLPRLSELLKLSHQIGMDCLVEVHNEEEVRIALDSGARIIGINNRDLRTFEVDISTTFRLRQIIPADRIVVSESGIKSRNDLDKLEEIGINAALIGETLMAAPDIALKMRELL